MVFFFRNVFDEREAEGRRNAYNNATSVYKIMDQDLKDELWKNVQHCVCAPSRISQCVDIVATDYKNKQKYRNDKKAQDLENELKAKYAHESKLDESIFEEYTQEVPLTGVPSHTADFVV